MLFRRSAAGGCHCGLGSTTHSTDRTGKALVRPPSTGGVGPVLAPLGSAHVRRLAGRRGSTAKRWARATSRRTRHCRPPVRVALPPRGCEQVLDFRPPTVSAHSPHPHAASRCPPPLPAPLPPQDSSCPSSVSPVSSSSHLIDGLASGSFRSVEGVFQKPGDGCAWGEAAAMWDCVDFTFRSGR